MWVGRGRLGWVGGSFFLFFLRGGEGEGGGRCCFSVLFLFVSSNTGLSNISVCYDSVLVKPCKCIILRVS